MKLVIILEMILSKIEEGGRGDEETGGCWRRLEDAGWREES
ncbi:MAG TPA: hypothetical protein PK028_01555 [Bacteroidales bacterium]|jgi:hypothetical protein|nr:hypothetical protein [Bacteroidota bacterium]OQC60882.1 MAG: hypothetical protein BWX51_00746 [Bacteroidetes bacterium ADurb.Bin012]HNQ59136.1 hypothetical protein [Bacteroidales bacterium]HNU20808.1 hypothetical protein [Bacteroidales bacterium]HNV16458.1 hypothetical protein [Bacteroidales bacterium]